VTRNPDSLGRIDERIRNGFEAHVDADAIWAVVTERTLSPVVPLRRPRAPRRRRVFALAVAACLVLGGTALAIGSGVGIPRERTPGHLGSKSIVSSPRVDAGAQPRTQGGSSVTPVGPEEGEPGASSAPTQGFNDRSDDGQGTDEDEASDEQGSADDQGTGDDQAGDLQVGDEQSSADGESQDLTSGDQQTADQSAETNEEN
jgi:hypothetical protein